MPIKEERDLPGALVEANWNPNDAIFSERRNRFKRAERSLLEARIPAAGLVLDLGCGGGGDLDARWRAAGARVVACDIHPRYLAAVSAKAGAPIGVGGTAWRLPLRDAAFDAVVFTEVIEHVPADRQAAALAEIARVLKPAGRLFLSTPNRPVYRLCRRLARLLRGQWPFTPYARLVPQHVAELAEGELRALLAGWEIASFEPLNPYLPRSLRARLPIGFFVEARNPG